MAMASSNILTLSILLASCVAVCLGGTGCTRAEIDKENLKKLATANNELALNIHRQLVAESSENVFFSPFSLSTAFGMLFYGTKGETAQELRHALGYENANLPSELVHETFHSLAESLKSKDPSSYVLNSANAILFDESLNVVPSYRKEVEDLYEASVKDVNFMSHTTEVLEEINTWVKEKTNGKIEKLLEELPPSVIFVLLNAIYFKGTWETQFDPEFTRPDTFYNNGLESNSKQVPMMRLKERFPYTLVSDLQAVELPYKGNNISMLILLPNKRDGLKSLEESLTLEKLSTIRQKLYKIKVELALPKFKLQYSRDMSSEFRAVGAKSIFNPGADFSGMTTDKNVCVTQVLHKAVVEVNEEGSEAAGVTAALSSRMRPMTFVADHPFLFAIVDRRSDMILFLGRVTSL